MRVFVLRAALAALVTASGCSDGDGWPAGAGATAAGVRSDGRDPLGYGWSEAGVGSAGATVASLAVLSSGEALLAEAPAPRVWRLAPGGAPALDGLLPAAATGFAELEGRVFAATADPALPGAGDVLERGPAGWETSLDGEAREARLVVLGGRLHALEGDEATPARVHVLSAQGWLTSGALPRPGAPVALAAFGAELWAAIEGPGGPGLFRRARSTWEEVALPLPQVPGPRPRLVALLGEPHRLLVAVAALEPATGHPEWGQLLAWEGGGFSLLHGLSADAPLALGRHEGALWVGTARGRLLAQDPAGVFLDEPGLPPCEALTGLAPASAGELLVAARRGGGASLLRRLALGAQPASAPPPAGGGGTAPVASGGAIAPVGSGGASQGPDYDRDVRPILAARCTRCHERASAFRLSPGLADPAADRAAILTRIDPARPAESPLLRKGADQDRHAGGRAIDPASAEFATLLAWVGAGAPLSAAAGPAVPPLLPPANPGPVGSGATPAPVGSGATPAPVGSGATPAPVGSGAAPPSQPAPPPQQGPPAGTPGYVRDVKPVLLASCVRCHARRSSFRVSTDLTQDASDYQAVLLQVNTAAPAASPLLVRPSDTANHPVRALDPTGPEHALLLRWIGAGAPFSP